MLVIAGIVKVKPETRAEAIQAAVKMARATRQEAGCISYGFSPTSRIRTRSSSSSSGRMRQR